MFSLDLDHLSIPLRPRLFFHPFNHKPCNRAAQFASPVNMRDLLQKLQIWKLGPFFNVCMPKEGVERSHRPDMMCREVCCMHRAVKNKPNQLMRALADEEWPEFGL